MSLAKAVIMGIVQKTPEKRYTSNDVPITGFSINISEKDEPSLVRVIAKGKLAETVADSVSKNDKVIVEGRLQTTVVKTTTGDEKKVIEIDARAVESVGAPSQESYDEPVFVDESEVDELIGEEEIPF